MSWIDMKTKLPEENTAYWIWTELGARLGYWQAKQWYDLETTKKLNSSVTSWHELTKPPLPKAKNSKKQVKN